MLRLAHARPDRNCRREVGLGQAVLARYSHLETIPADPRDSNVKVANPAKLAKILHRDRDRALLFRKLATLRTDIELFDDVDTLRL
jgi:5'-3' exonuclease